MLVDAGWERHHRHLQAAGTVTIPIELAGALIIGWLAIAIPTVVHLAGRKTDTRTLTIFWGVVAAVVPIFGLLFILGLLLKDDRLRA
jgi:hypothetical protein